MGIIDAFKPEDRTEITFSNFYNLIKQAAQYEIVMNAVNCDIPHTYIRETMTGKKEDTWKRLEEAKIPPDMIVTGGIPSNYLGSALAGSALAVPPQNTNDKIDKKKGEKSNGKNEPEI